jgi:hypothetical protein
MPNEGIWKALWWLCLFVAPAVLLTIELFHPAAFTINPGMYQYLSKPEAYDPHHYALAYPGPDWWFLLHMIQTPMVGLVAVGLWIMVGRVTDADGAAAVALAWLSRVATFVFVIYYTALDAIGGFGLARSIIDTQNLANGGKLTPDQVKGVETLLNVTWVDPWTGGVGSFISLTGSWAIFIAAVLAAAALFLTRKVPWPPLVVLVAFGWELQTSHASPYGPIAFGLLIIAALWIWWAERRATLAAA